MKFDVTLVPLLPKGGRYFVRCGASTAMNRGWKKRAEVDAWFARLHAYGWLDWRVGSVFRLHGLPVDLLIVNRKGERC